MGGLHAVARFAGLMLALGCPAPLACAQSNYATPYTFTTLAGSPGLAGVVQGTGPAARFNAPSAVAVETNGNIFVADYSGHTIRKIAPVANVTQFATIAAVGSAIPALSPLGVAVDGSGNVYASDSSSHRILKITSAGSVSFLAGGPIFYSVDVNLSFALPGSADGTGQGALFRNPAGVAVDKNGFIYVGDSGNHLIRKISPAGVVTTLAGAAGVVGNANGIGGVARFNGPRGVAVDGDLNVYVADMGNHIIRKITAGGVVTTLAGLAGTLGSLDATGTAARFYSPHGVAADSAGNVYVADYGNHLIRKITPAGVVTTLAGLAGSPGSNDGTGDNVRFRVPSGIAVDQAGVLYVADANNHTIRMSVALGFTAQPAAQAVTPGTSATFTATANSNMPLTYQWRKDGVAISGATAPTFTVSNVQASNLGTYTLVATTAFNSATSNPATLSFITAPNFTLHPASQTAAVGAPANFTASATGIGFISYQWLKDGSAIPGATTSTLSIANVQAANLGTYTVIASNGSGPTVSNPATLAFTAPPSFTTHPASQSLPPGATATFTASVTGSGLITYQWLKDGISLPGATTGTLVVPNVQSANLGNYLLIASNLGGPSTSDVAILSFNAPPAGRLTNLSIRTAAGTGAQTLIVGLVVGGAGTTGTKPLLIRGVGPTLGVFGVPGFLADPTLSVFSGGTVVSSNDNWSGDAQVVAIGAQVGAFALNAATSRDAALYRPALDAGSYTVQIGGIGGTTGITLAEIYDATPANAFLAATPRLVNVSARTQVGTGADILITGFNIGGATPKTLLIRAVGPTLSVFGVTGVLADPKLDLFSGSTVLQSNDNWAGASAIGTAATSVGAFPLDATSRDAVLLVTLQPGSYTAQVSGVGATTGVALVEIYEVP